jgi:dihydroorotate dehydrogenase
MDGMSFPPLMLDLATPFLRLLDPEKAHRLAVKGLSLLPAGRVAAPDPALRTSAFGLDFPNPVGLAAGFDKDAEAIGPVFRLGFGFVEAGGVTPRPQPGNPKPRVFRLPEDRAVINRYGLNSAGVDAMAVRLARRDRDSGLVGVNLGPNKDSADRIADFVMLIDRLAPLADYLSVNISSPNTPGLRDLQEADALRFLMQAALQAADRVAAGRKRTPILFKIAPDLDDAVLFAILDAALEHRIDGLIIANTTIARPPTLSAPAGLTQEIGGLSGAPVFAASTRMLAKAFLHLEGRIPLIGVGGVDSAETALAKIEAGATLIQFYTGLIYRGPGLVGEILSGLAAAALAKPLAERRGVRAAEIAAGRMIQSGRAIL